MTLAIIQSAGLEGLDGYPVELEVSLGSGFMQTKVIGLPDAALKESRDRVKAAFHSCKLKYPQASVTVNLAPARRRKEEGSAFDLPIALGVLATGKRPRLKPKLLEGVAALGELALSGATRPVRGALAAGETLARTGCQRLLVSRASAPAAALGARGRLEVIPIDDLKQALGYLNGTVEIPPLNIDASQLLTLPTPQDQVDLGEVQGAEQAKTALVLAAAGGHDLLLIGPPGSGKTMLARRLPGLLPPLTVEEALEITRIHTTGRAFDPAQGDVLVNRRPFRAPHHTASPAAVVGGGTPPRPGEISLAHGGVLFLDELPEFPIRTLEALREPLEAREVTISRSRYSVTFPCRFQLVAAMNPCPCGTASQPTGNSSRSIRTCISTWSSWTTTAFTTLRTAIWRPTSSNCSQSDPNLWTWRKACSNTSSATRASTTTSSKLVSCSRSPTSCASRLVLRRLKVSRSIASSSNSSIRRESLPSRRLAWSSRGLRSGLRRSPSLAAFRTSRASALLRRNTRSCASSRSLATTT